MKKKAAIFGLALCLLAGAAVLVKFNLKQQSEKLNAESRRVVLVAPHANNRYWNLITAGLAASATEHGISFKVDEPISNSDNIGEITNMIECAVDARVDAIVVRGEMDDDYITALEKAQEKGILVAFIDADNDAFPRKFYVGTDNALAGRQMAQAVVERIGEAANIAILTSSGTAEHMAERENGFREVCDQYPDITISYVIDEQWSNTSAITQIKYLLEAYPEIDTLVTLEGYGTLAINTMVSEGSLEGLNLFCFDYDSENYKEVTESGKITGFLTQQPYRMGYVCMEKLAGIWEGTEMDPDSEYIPTMVVDSDNVDSFVEEGV